MSQQRFRAVYARGGTSKALLFLASDLPADREAWSPLFLKALGSPDPYGRQLDGMGGGLSSLSKVAIVAPSSRGDADVDYTFAQVMVDEPRVEYRGNCGNILAAVGPFAVEEGLLSVTAPQACVRIFNTNTRKHILSRFPLDAAGRPATEGGLMIPGVAGSGAPIQLEFLDPGGASTGRLLPTGRVREWLSVPDVGEVDVSMVDAGNASVFVSAESLGLSGVETPQQLQQADGLLARLESIRAAASVAMGIAADPAAARRSKAIPYLGIVAAAADFTTLGGARILAADQDLSARVIASGQPHLALPLTVSLCLAIAARLEGSLVHAATAGPARGAGVLRIGMPSGVLVLDACVEHDGGHWAARSGSFYRTARRLFEGFVYA